MNIETVNELIQSLESAGELSIKETKVMALAKAYHQLAAENVALKESRNNLAEFIHEELDADYPLNMNLETHATDRIVAGIKADGVEMFALMFAEEAIKDNNITTGWKARASRAASEYAELLREGAGK
ncbi:Uncharacterised protein [Klebsiella pneumoniae]|uniref:hypothetical protein n=1 Tax=Klebsiella TaxID=570 RepID=UPI0010D51139|nr:hypothetical protein [Klebsiella pneumoniae]VTM84880.1 Uncharacterised protein [Klebsiella pneumoniae]HBW3180321.1 hypothetical protein [Klebsiella pneumoniae]